jgi:von Willebrand factor type A domain
MSLLPVAALLLIVAALPVGFRLGENQDGVLLIDVSSSVGMVPGDLADLGRRAGVDPERTDVVIFGEAALHLGRRGEAWPTLSRAEVDRVGRAGSDLAAGLRVAEGLPGAAGRVVVLTDGRVGEEGLPSAASRLLSRGGEIEFLSAGRAAPGDFRVVSLRAPSRVAGKGSFLADVVVFGPVGGENLLRLAVDGREVARRAVRIGSTGTTALRLDVPSGERGYREVAATLDRVAGDTEPLNDRLVTGVVATDGKSALLVGANELAPALAAAGYEVRTGTPETAGRGVDDLIVLHNVSALELEDGGKRLASFVRAGGGLVLLGGPRSFGPGGYAGRPISSCLPVRSAPEGEGLTVMVLLDRSGTMGERFGQGGEGAKLPAALRAIRSLLASLPDEADFSLLSFAEETDGSVLSAALDASGRSAAGEAIDRVGEATGSTALIPPLHAARIAAPPGADRKWLVLLVTDGQLVSESESDVLAEAEALRRAGARLEVLAVGENARIDLLDRMTGQEGSVRRISEAGAFERSFLDALSAFEGEGRIREGSFEVVRGVVPSPALRIPLEPVGGYVRTWARPEAVVWAWTSTGSPLLAWRRFGLGQAVAVMTDPLGDWAPDWGRGDLLAALGDRVARPGELGGPRVRATRAGDRLLLRVGSRRAGGPARGILSMGAGFEREVEFVPSGPREFTGSVAIGGREGAAFLGFDAGGQSDLLGLSVPYADELRASGPDEGALAALSARYATGKRSAGRVGLAVFLGGLGLVFLLLDRLVRTAGGWAALKGSRPGRR